MAFLRFSVSAVIFLHGAIFFTTFFSLHSEWSFLGMVNCQDGSSYLADMGAVDDSASSAIENAFSGMQEQGINECCKECQNDEGGCVPNCDACELLEGASFFKFLPAVHQHYYITKLARENYYPATSQENSGEYDQDRNMIYAYRNGYQNPNVVYPHRSGYQNSNVMHPYRSNYQNPNAMYSYESKQSVRRCCADCLDGDIYCLSSCQRYGCKPTAVCANAGPGAYGSFCQRQCGDDQLRGFSAMTMTFLPDRACRANCAKYVQQMCAKNNCRDYGCIVSNCASRAVAICG